MLAARDRTEDSLTIAKAVAAQLSDLPVELRTEWVEALPSGAEEQKRFAEDKARETGAALVFWCDLGHKEQTLFIFFPDPGKGGVLVRELQGSGKGGVSETLAIIVRSSASTIINHSGAKESHNGRDQTADEDSMAKDYENPPKPKAPPSPKPETESLIDLEPAYAINVHSSADPAVSGFSLGLAVHLGKGWAVSAAYLFFAELKENGADVELSLRRHPTWLGGRYAHRFGAFDVGAGLALVIDYLSESISTFSPNLAAQPGGSDVQISAVPMFRASLGVFESIRVFVAVGAEIPINPVRYVADDSNGKQVVYESWPVQPMGLAGLSLGIF